MFRRLDHFTIACYTILICVAAAAIVVLIVTNHDADVRSAIVAIASILGSAVTITSVQSVRNGVGQTNQSIENGILKDKIRDGVAEYMENRSRQFTQNPDDNEQESK